LPEYRSFALALPFIFDAQVASLGNMDRLVLHPRQMPGGFELQNMVFSPIVCVLQYLEKTGQPTEELKIKVVGFLQTGSSDLLRHFFTPSTERSCSVIRWFLLQEYNIDYGRGKVVVASAKPFTLISLPPRLPEGASIQT